MSALLILTSYARPLHLLCLAFAPLPIGRTYAHNA